MATTSLSPFLFERSYWAERLASLEATPNRVLLVPRPECSGGETRVEELWLRAVDGSRLRALLVQPSRGVPRDGLTVLVEAWSKNVFDEEDPVRLLEWPDLRELASRAAEGRSLLLVAATLDRRLEDRVLDLLRTIDGAHACRRVRPGAVEFEARGDGDAVRIARELLQHEWT